MLTREQFDAIPRRGEPDSGYGWREISPDGRWAIVVRLHDARMSHWIAVAELYRLAPLERVIPIGDTLWSCDVARFEDASTLVIEARRYPGDLPGATLRLRLDEERASVRIATGEEHDDLDFSALVDLLCRWPEHQSPRR
jgi:hypothetical protein